MKYRNFKQARAHGVNLKEFNRRKKIAAAWRLRKKFKQYGKTKAQINETIKALSKAKPLKQKGARRDYIICGFRKKEDLNKSPCEFNFSQNYAQTKKQLAEWRNAWKKKYFRVKTFQRDITQKQYEAWRKRAVNWAAKNLIDLSWTYEPELYAVMFWIYPE